MTSSRSKSLALFLFGFCSALTIVGLTGIAWMLAEEERSLAELSPSKTRSKAAGESRTPGALGTDDAEPPSLRGLLECPDDAVDARQLLMHANRNIMLGDLSASVRCGRQALKIDPQMMEAHTILGAAYVRMGRYCNAKLHFRTFVEHDPHSVLAPRISHMLDEPPLRDCP